ncbi:hypothetical protein HDV00_011752 [Rhizophlyctis rosea]|nr:hypothetical protein HDV00_011752 [Rhizophlyctis rosea]
MTSPPKPHVIIIGAGIGGLALAQGLKQHSIPFTIYERDSSPYARSQGYRVRINEAGSASLKRVLPADVYELFEQTCAETILGFKWRDQNGEKKEVKFGGPGGGGPPRNEGDGSGMFSADRATLRGVLLTGLELDVRFGKEFVNFEESAEGKVIGNFSDGETVEGDLLVAADGTNSRVRRQLFPDRNLLDTTGRVVYGKTLITPELEAAFHEDALEGGITVFQDSRPVSIFMEPIRFTVDPHDVASHLPSQKNYVYWVLLANQKDCALSDHDFMALQGDDIKSYTLNLTKDWSPSITSLLTLAQPHLLAPLRIFSNPTLLPEWQPHPHVTFLGDTIHAMAPTAGLGANTALQDAANLVEVIASGGGAVEPSAIAVYESSMREYASKAIGMAQGGGRMMFGQPPLSECKVVGGDGGHVAKVPDPEEVAVKGEEKEVWSGPVGRGWKVSDWKAGWKARGGFFGGFGRGGRGMGRGQGGMGRGQREP